MARILTSNPVFQLGFVAGVITTVRGQATDSESATLSSTNIVNESVGTTPPLVSVHGVFHDDPTWDSFMESLEEYRKQVDAFERTLD